MRCMAIIVATFLWSEVWAHDYGYCSSAYGVLVPSAEESLSWIGDKSGFKEERSHFLEGELLSAKARINGLGGDKLIKALNALPIDPYAETYIVPPHYYGLWCYLTDMDFDAHLVEEALSKQRFIHMVDMHGNVLPEDPRVYIALNVYKTPTEKDIQRWLSSDPRNELRGQVLWASFEHSQYPDSFYKKECSRIIREDKDPTIKVWAANILISIDGGREMLQNHLSDDSLDDALKPALQNVLESGRAIWRKKKE